MIRFDSVVKRYPGTKRAALEDINIEILRGEFVFLVGSSGSGKSSFLRLILKEERPSEGDIHVLGQNLRAISNRKVPYFRRNIGVVFQDFRLLPNKSVFDNVAFTLQVIGKSRGFIHSAVPETLALVGLAEKGKRFPHELSGGEQQRVAIARAIVNKPQLVLADEPTGNLDPTTSAGIMALLERINASGTTVIMSTHEAGIVNQMRRRVVEISAGRIVRDDTQGVYRVGEVASAAVDAEVAAHAAETAAATAISAAAAAAGNATEQRPVADNPMPVPPPAPSPQSTGEVTTTVMEAVMESRQPLYVEPVVEDEVTREADRITAAATAQIPVQEPATSSGPIVVPGIEDAAEPLTLAERLGLRSPNAHGTDDEQEVGPTR